MLVNLPISIHFLDHSLHPQEPPGEIVHFIRRFSDDRDKKRYDNLIAAFGGIAGAMDKQSFYQRAGVSFAQERTRQSQHDLIFILLLGSPNAIGRETMRHGHEIKSSTSHMTS